MKILKVVQFLCLSILHIYIVFISVKDTCNLLYLYLLFMLICCLIKVTFYLLKLPGKS